MLTEKMGQPSEYIQVNTKRFQFRLNFCVEGFPVVKEHGTYIVIYGTIANYLQCKYTIVSVVSLSVDYSWRH